MLGRIFCLASHRGDRLETDENENCNRRLNKHPAPFVHADHRRCVGMGQEVAGRVSRRIRDDERNRLTGFIEQRQRCPAGIAHDRSVLGAGGELVGKGLLRLRVVLETRRAGGMIGAVAKSQNAESYQRRNLNHIHGDVDRRGGAGSLGGDPGHEEGEEHRDDGHKEQSGIGAAHEGWI